MDKSGMLLLFSLSLKQAPRTTQRRNGFGFTGVTKDSSGDQGVDVVYRDL